ncbi:carbamoyl phosphate synthase small subunit [Candidatus Marinamargulisbacteria bacterium SCGC AG-439-L15]|nr:carbamoyl phosphate synthase small subunit [Candidatus Marinamargulisbacteria bacterium SCGC AG-439-L15]
MKKARLIFNDGKVFHGKLFSEGKDTISEVVFNTAMTGYQEILTDPSYSGQFVVMTYPHIGSYGINDEDIESRKLFLDGLIVRDYVDTYSNWRATKSLKTYLQENEIIGLTDVDTRALTKYIRESGAKKALLTTSEEPVDVLSKTNGLDETMTGADLVQFVTCDKPYTWQAPEKEIYRIAVIDCGVKYNILEMLRKGGCLCDIYSVDTPIETLLEKNYDGFFISNGPGDPEPTKNAIGLVKQLLGKKPLYGICLGHQIISLALGAKTFKLKFGHHGANHPVKNLATGKVEITSQNHGFAVDPDSLEGSTLKVTHVNLNDHTVAGVADESKLVASVQYHPEAAPGPHDSEYFFQDFFTLLDAGKERG